MNTHSLGKHHTSNCIHKFPSFWCQHKMPKRQAGRQPIRLSPCLSLPHLCHHSVCHNVLQHGARHRLLLDMHQCLLRQPRQELRLNLQRQDASTCSACAPFTQRLGDYHAQLCSQHVAGAGSCWPPTASYDSRSTLYNCVLMC